MFRHTWHRCVSYHLLSLLPFSPFAACILVASVLPSFLPSLSEATINPLSERRSLFLCHYRQQHRATSGAGRALSCERASVRPSSAQRRRRGVVVLRCAALPCAQSNRERGNPTTTRASDQAELSPSSREDRGEEPFSAFSLKLFHFL